MLPPFSRERRIPPPDVINCLKLLLLLFLLNVGLAGGADTRQLFPQWPELRPSGRTIRLSSGLVRGRILAPSSSRLQEVEVFLGIPYASPPQGRLRFRAPQPPESWEGVRELDTMAPVCVQAFPNISSSNNKREELHMSTARLNFLRRIQPFVDNNQSEDCLYLNIYMPAAHRPNDNKIPVLVVLSSGDSYSWGTGNYVDGSVIAAYSNSIIVTLNYRLGVLGFLPTRSSGSVSNAGLRDQIEALRWLRLNLASFGGDRDKVTLLGAGKAAALVHLHMLNPGATDLFKRAALIGGSALSSWAICHDAEEQVTLLAKSLGCGSQPNPIECFRERSAEELVQMSSNLLVPEYLCGPFGPTPDEDLVSLDMYAATAAYASRTNPFGQHDLLAGVTKWENLQLFNDYERIHGIEAEFKERIFRTLVRNSYVFHQNEILFSIMNEYTDWSRGELSTIDLLQETSQALSDANTVAPLLEVATLHSRSTTQSKSQRSTYLYVFSYQSASCDYSHLYSCTPDSQEALTFLLGIPLLDRFTPPGFSNYSRQDAQVSQLMLDYLNNFMRTGQPNSSTIETVNPERPSRPVTEEISWRQFESIHEEYLLVDSRPQLLQHFNAHRMSIWNRLIPALHRANDEFETINENNNLSLSLQRFSNRPPTYRLPLLVALQSTSAPLPRSFTIDPLLSSAPVASTSVLPIDKQFRSFEGGDHLPFSLESLASGPYSKALFITIAVGCSLLVVNLLVFIGTYYQHRTDLENSTNTSKRNYRKIHSSSSMLEGPSLYDSLAQKNAFFKNSSEVQDMINATENITSLTSDFCLNTLDDVNSTGERRNPVLYSDIEPRYQNVTKNECPDSSSSPSGGETTV